MRRLTRQSNCRLLFPLEHVQQPVGEAWLLLGLHVCQCPPGCADCQWHTHMLQVQLSLLANRSIRIERGLDAVTKARGVHGRDKKVRRRKCASCSCPIEGSGSVRAVWVVVGVAGYGGGLSCTLCFQHGRAGLMAWKIVRRNNTLVCVSNSAPLRLGSGLWQARENAFLPSSEKLVGLDEASLKAASLPAR